MTKWIGIILIYLFDTILAGILAVGLLIAGFYFKKRYRHMTENTWRMYLKTFKNYELLLRAFIVYFIALCLIAIMSFFLFKFFRYTHALELSLIFICLSIIGVFIEYFHDKEKWQAKLDKIRQ